MPLLRNTMHSNSPTSAVSTGAPLRSPWLALVLPITLAAGCANGPNSRPIIDYTVSEAEYFAATAAQSPASQRLPAPQSVAAASVIQQPPADAPQKATSIVAAEVIAEASNASNISEPQTAEPTLAAAFDKKAYIDGLGFSKSVYATIGLGSSRLNPDTSAAPGWNPNERVVPAGQVAVGVDLGKRLSVELHSGDYGSAGLSPEGRVNYHMNGVSALFYAGKNVDRFRRRGLNGYARVGFNQLENSPVGNIPFIKQTSQHASIGLGAEYMSRIGLGVRADVIAYDGDVKFGQLGLLYRMGKKPARAKLATAANDTVTPQPEEPSLTAAMPAPSVPAPTLAAPSMPAPSLPAPAAAPAIVAPAATTALDTTLPTARNDDAIIDLAAFGEQPPRVVNETTDACSELNGTLNGVNFYRGSADLTEAATSALNTIAQTLQGCADRDIEITAHTDNTGSAMSNNLLSKNRARQVVTHLALQGISINRMKATAYGESDPIASNSTLDGRMQNRRVDLYVR